MSTYTPNLTRKAIIDGVVIAYLALLAIRGPWLWHGTIVPVLAVLAHVVTGLVP